MSDLPGDDPLYPLRRETQARLEAAVGEGRLTLDEFTERVGVVWSANTSAELEVVTRDLPVPVVSGAAPSSSVLLAVFGDVKRRGRWSLRPRTWVWTLFGDVRLDLGSALISDREVEINAVLLFGDLKVTVPAGVEVEVNGLALFGDRELDLAAVPRAPGTPRIRVRAFALFGDVKVRSRS